MGIKRGNLLKEKEKRNNIIYSKIQKAWKIAMKIEQIQDWEL